MSDDKEKKEYTENIEKGMQQSHGVTQEEYEQSLEKKIEVEKEREKEYEKTKKLHAELDRQLKK